MSNYFDYSSTIDTINEKDQKIISYSSISYSPQLPLKTSMIKTKITQKEKYRPDKVSYRLFGDPNLSWLLDEINNFYSLSDYYPEREIYYLGSKGLSSIGIEIDYVSYETQNY
jgi:hypothetical protein